MENATSKQIALLVKLGLDKSEAQKLTKIEASKKIKELLLSNNKIKDKKAETKTTKSKSTKTASSTKTSTTSTTKTNNKVDEIFLNAIKQEYSINKEFSKLFPENKLDELATYSCWYAKTNQSGGTFGFDGNLLLTLAKELVETLDNGGSVNDLMKESKKETKVKEAKTTTTKTTTSKTKKETPKKETKVETKEKELSAYEQLCIELGI